MKQMISKISRLEYTFATIAVGTLFALLSCATTERTTENYHSIQKVLPSESYTAVTDGPSDEVQITGNGQTVLLSSGISGFAINGNWHELDRRPVFQNGQLHLSKSDAKTLRKALSTSEPTVATTKKTATHSKDAFTVVIDPGHGGKFVGARGINGRLEKQLNLKVAKYAERNLEEAVDVELTRSSDRSLSSNHKQDLDERVQYAHRQDADLFISIHANAARSSSANGFELYVNARDDRPETIQRLKSWHPDPSTTTHSTAYQSYQQMYQAHRQKSYRLARLIRNRFKQVIPTGSRGVKSKSLHVLRNAPCPAVLVELGFMTNQYEANLLSRTSYQRKLGRKIAEAVKSFRRSLAQRTSN